VAAERTIIFNCPAHNKAQVGSGTFTNAPPLLAAVAPPVEEAAEDAGSAAAEAEDEAPSLLLLLLLLLGRPRTAAEDGELEDLTASPLLLRLPGAAATGTTG